MSIIIDDHFLHSLKKIFEKIPVGAKFLKDIGLPSNYSGYRFFMLGRKSRPSLGLLNKMADKLDYKYVTLPIPNTIEGDKLIQESKEMFLEDLEKYIDKFKDDKPRIYMSKVTGHSVLGEMFEDESQDDFGLSVDDDVSADDLF